MRDLEGLALVVLVLSRLHGGPQRLGRERPEGDLRPDQPLERQRERLLTGAAALQARTGSEVTVVFDAADLRDRPLVSPPRGIRVRFSPVGVIADDVIRDLVAAEPRGRAVAVVTSDQAVARDVEAAGFRVVRSATLVAPLGLRSA